MPYFIASYDFETALVENGMGVPPWVCFSWEIRDESYKSESGLITVNGEWSGDIPPGYIDPGKVDPLVVLQSIYAQVEKKAEQGYHSRLVNQNIPFDNLVACRAYGELITPIFRLYRKGLIEDPMIREMLIDLAAGYLGYVRGAKNKKTGKQIKRRYDLADVAKRRLDKEMDKETHRKNFWSLVETPLKDWPQGAIDYVLGDATTAIDVYFHQRDEVRDDIPDGEVPDSLAQSRAHWALNLAAAWGIRTHAGRVSAFKRQLEIDLDILKKALQTVGFIRSGAKESKNKKVIEEYLVRIAETAGFELPRTDPEGKTERYKEKHPDGAIKQGAAVIDDLLESLNINFFVKEEGKTEQQQAITLAQSMIAGQVSSGNVLTVQVGGEIEEVEDEEEGVRDKQVLEEKSVKIEERDLKALAILSFHTSTQKLLKTYVPPMEHGTKWPINPYFHPVLETGRISCRKPNLTNLPRAAGVRECYIPREGNVFCSVDYASMELHTLAQCCFTWLGESRLREVLNDKIDPHLQFAIDFFLEGISYKDAYRILKSEDKALNDAEYKLKKNIKAKRNISKQANFGLPGGLGAAKFVQFCKPQGVIITEDEAREIKANWLQMWPEMRKYFKYINALMYEDDDDEESYATMEQLFSGRIRGRTRYTAACNTGFQGLGADLAKAACFDLQEACYVPGVNDILYGSRLVCFVHDESIMEHPLDETTHERAMEQTKIMLAVSPRFVPDVPLRAEPALMSCWTKDAEAAYDENNRLIPWSPSKK